MHDYLVTTQNILPPHRCTCKAPQDVYCRVHVNLDMEIVLVREGTLAMCIGGAETVIGAGKGVFVLPFETHDFRTQGHSRVLIYTFPGDLVRPMGQFLATHAPLSRTFAVPPQLFDWLAAACPPPERGDNVPDVEEAGMVAPLLSLLCRECTFTDAPDRENDLFLSALTYIDRHYTEEMSLLTAARALGVTDKKLSRIFARAAGVPFSEYVTLRRLSTAQRLLSAGEKSVAQAAYQAGFSSIRTFNRAFRRFRGVTPREYVRQAAAPDHTP